MSAAPTTKPPLIPSVETLPCPAHDGNHVLVNRDLATYCRWCRTSWADLDADVRARVVRPKRRRGRKP